MASLPTSVPYPRGAGAPFRGARPLRSKAEQPLVGCMTGAANAVSEQLARIDLPPRVSRFLHALERVTFGWAGAHQQEGRERPGAWCPFRLSDWVERTGMTRSQILQIRQRLVEDGFIWYEADAGRRGQGRIGWNLDVASWKPLAPEHPRWGGARPGAGRPRKTATEADVINLKNSQKDAMQADLGARAVPGKTSRVALEKSEIFNLKKTQRLATREVAPAPSTPGVNSSSQLEKREIFNLKNQQDETIQAKAPARSTPGQKSSWQHEEREIINLKNAPETASRENAPAPSTPGGNSSWKLKKSVVINLKNQQDEATQADTPARSRPGRNSSWQQKVPAVINLKNGPDEKSKENTPARSTPGGNSSWQQLKNSSLKQRGGSQDFKVKTQVAAQPALEAEPDPVSIKELRKNKTETPIVVSAAADAAPQESVDQDHSDHLETPEANPFAALTLHVSPPARAAASPVLQVPIAQLEQWRADVAEQRQVVAHAQATNQRAGKTLDQCSPGSAGWGDLRREQRYLQHQLEAEQGKLAQFDLFVSLIEQGATRDEACEQVYTRQMREASPETAQVPECSDDTAEAAARTQASPEPAAPAPLQPKAWRAALFTGVLALFGWEIGRLNQNSRGMVNRAAMLLQESGIRPEQLPRLKQLFEQAYPKVRNYTPMALANHATEFVAAL